mgnify:CR=1 FL=1
MNMAQPRVGKNVFSQLPVSGWAAVAQSNGDKHRVAPSHVGQVRMGLSGWKTVNRAGNSIME